MKDRWTYLDAEIVPMMMYVCRVGQNGVACVLSETIKGVQVTNACSTWYAFVELGLCSS